MEDRASRGSRNRPVCAAGRRAVPHGRHAEACDLAQQTYESHLAAHGERADQTVEALGVLLGCNKQTQSIPHNTLIPLIQQYLVHLRRSNQDGSKDGQIWEHLVELHTLQWTRQALAKDKSAFRVTSRELMQLARKHAATNYETYIWVGEAHAEHTLGALPMHTCTA